MSPHTTPAEEETPRVRWLLAAHAALGLYLVLLMPVFAQESYYWCYAQHPSLSYYDHPPMVAWLIWLGTEVFGDGGLGIRLGTWVCGMLTVLAGLGLLRQFAAPARARALWLFIGLLVPTVTSTKFLANPDPPLTAFWMLTLLTLWKTREGKLGWWILAGVLAGGALLSKYTAIFLAIGGVLVLLSDQKMRRQLLRPGPWVGVLAAGVTFLPVLLWNYGNDFESFRFQTAGRWNNAEFGLRWFGQFVGGQLLVLNPPIAVGIVLATWWLIRRRWASDIRVRWVLAFGLPMPLFLLGTSLFVQVKINWLAPVIPVLLLALPLWWIHADIAQRHPIATRRLARGAVAYGALLLLAPLVILFPQRKGTTWTGWQEIAGRAEHWEEEIDDADGIEGNVFFFAADYRDAAQLTRHLRLSFPEFDDGEQLEPTLAQNVTGLVALQFDHWENPRDRIGQDAIFVLPRPEQREGFVNRVRDCFEAIERVDRVEIRRLGILVLTADIFVCRDYRGPIQ